MPLAFYKILHYLGIFVLVVTLGAALGRGAQPQGAEDPWRKRFAQMHGMALVLIVFGGFGMLARLGLGMPGWAWAKTVVWAALGGLIVVARKSPTWSARALVMVPLLALLAGALAFTKPF